MKRLSRFMLFAFVLSLGDRLPVAAGPLAPPDVLHFAITRVAAQVSTAAQRTCAPGSGGSERCRASSAQHTTRPSAASITLPAHPVPAGAWVEISAAFHDANPRDQHSATIEWGDGSTTELEASGSLISASHRYAAGVYAVTLSVRGGERSDSRSGSAERTSYVVVYDPARAHVSGNGWIRSRAGRCTLDEACKAGSGVAKFGFVFRYQKGGSAPVDYPQLQFQDGAFRFQSATHDWLAVSGAQAEFRGSGSVNHEPGYEFLLTVNDGDLVRDDRPDGIRIRIWHRLSGRLVYDSQQATISGGSITIRT